MVVTPQHAQAWEKENEKFVETKRKNQPSAVIHEIVHKVHSLNDESVKYIELKQVFISSKEKKRS